MDDPKTIEFLGLTWTVGRKINNPELNQTIYFREEEGFNSLALARDVIEYVNANTDLHYQLLSVLYEQHLLFPKKVLHIFMDDDQKAARLYTSGGDFDNKQSSFSIDELLRQFPGNIAEILGRTLLNLSRQFPNRGQDIVPPNNFTNYSAMPVYWFFAKDKYEQEFIIDAMREKNWFISARVDGWPLKISVTGWLEIEQQIKNEKGKKIFVAMWFDDNMQEARKQIKNAIRDIGYVPSLIDEKPHNNEISGEILREINDSAYVIADVTGQRQGVYFEAGYAMGQKKQVIFCCKKEELIKIHFDTRQYNHIVWETELDLYNKLRNRLIGAKALK